MKKRLVCKILRKYSLVYPRMSDRDIGFIKNILAPDQTWKEFLYGVCWTVYLADRLPEEGVFIEELNLKLGGTLRIAISGPMAQPGQAADS